MRVFLLKCLDATAGLVLCWTVGWLRHVFGDERPAPRAINSAVIHRLLVVRPGGMGDMVLLLPALQRLRRRFPKSVMHVVCERRNRDILRLAGMEHEALVYDGNPIAFFKALRKGDYDVAIDTEQFHYFSALMAFLSGAPIRIGFKIGPGRNQLYTHLISYDMDGYEADQFMRLLEPLTAMDPSPQPEPPRGAGAAGWLTADPAAVPNEILRKLEQFEAAGRVIVVHPGGTSHYKRWAPEKTAELIARLADKPGRSFVLLGSRDERRVSETVVRAAGLPGRILSLTGQLTVAQSAAVIRRAALYVGGDSGLAHVAVALGVPTVIWFGPSDSRKWGVFGPRHRIVRRSPACAPCAIFGYHKLCHPVVCLADIRPFDVEEACEEILREMPP